MPIQFNRLPKIAAHVVPAVGAVVARTAFEVATDAASAAPVDTGALRASILARQEDPLTWTVSAGMYYGIFVELGTTKMPARPFLVPAAENAAEKLLAGIKVVIA